MEALNLIATAVFGLESEVAYELGRLGFEDLRIDHGKVLFRGDASAVARCNLWLRCADRLLVEVGRFPCRDFEALYEGVRAIPWKELVPKDAFMHVTGRSVKSQLTSVPAVQRVAKKAMVDALATGKGRLDESGARIPVHVALRKDEAPRDHGQLGGGASPEGISRPLHGRSHEGDPGGGARPAEPMEGRSSLPRSLVRIGGPSSSKRRSWPGTWLPDGGGASPPRPGRSSPRPSGPRRGRRPTIWPVPICPSTSGAAIATKPCVTMARRHARRAGLGEGVDFRRRDFHEVDLSQDWGVCLCNPPYGERLGERAEVEALYREMGRRFAERPTWSVYVITSYEGFEELYGRRASKRRKLFNGKLRCDLHQYHGPRPPRPSDEAE